MSRWTQRPSPSLKEAVTAPVYAAASVQALSQLGCSGLPSARKEEHVLLVLAAIKHADEVQNWFQINSIFGTF